MLETHLGDYRNELNIQPIGWIFFVILGSDSFLLLLFCGFCILNVCFLFYSNRILLDQSGDLGISEIRFSSSPFNYSVA